VGLFSRLSRPKDAAEAEATVLAMQLTAKAARQTDKRDRAHAFRLRISPQAELPYEVDLTATVPWDRLPRVGGTVPVWVSATDPQDVQIDFDRMPSLADQATQSAALAQQGDAASAARALGFELREPPPDRDDG
jgi:hypothetical protein